MDLAQQLNVMPSVDLGREEHIMLAIATILHPTDFSEHSEFAFRLACALARDYNAAGAAERHAAADGGLCGRSGAARPVAEP
jgi:hypothetical protein